MTDLPERRSHDSVRDIAIHFDQWGHAPLRALSRRIDEVLAARFGAQADTHVPETSFGWLAEKLFAASRQWSVRFLIILDAFEVHLALSETPAIALFDDELVEVVNMHILAANVLIAMDDDADPAFGRLRDRIVGCPEECLLLPTDGEAERAPPLEIPGTAPWEQEPEGLPPMAVAASFTSPALVARPPSGTEPEPVAGETPGEAPAPASGRWPVFEEWPPAEEQPAAAPTWTAVPLPVGTPATTMPHRDAEPPLPGRPAPEATVPVIEAPALPAPSSYESDAGAPVTGAVKPRDSRRRTLVVALVVAAAGALAWIALSPVGDRMRADGASPVVEPKGADAAPAPPPTAAKPLPPVRAVFSLLIDPDSRISARVAGELRDRVARTAGLDLRIRPFTHWSEGFEATAEPGQLAILRYDALRAARERRFARPLQVLMPLYTEPVYVIARSDARIVFIHQLEGRRINTGPASSARGMSAARLYRDLFGSGVPVGEATFDDAESALRKLVDDRGLDAMVVVGSELDALLGDKPPEWRARVRALRLDPANPASRRATQSFLPATAHGGALADDAPALSEVAFLVASDPVDPLPAAALGDLARSLCANLPGLQRDGHPKWREVRIGAPLDVGWPYLPAVEEAFRSCQPAASALR